MSMMVGRTNSNVRRIELKNADGTSAGSISYTVPGRKKKKRLQYNFKTLSTQLMLAKTSGNASQVAAKARRQIAMLQRNRRDEEYDSEEIKNAIAHAEGMERVARKRVKHLKQEEALKEDKNAYFSDVEDEFEDRAAKGMDPEEILKMSEEEIKQLMKELEQAMRELEAETAEKDMHHEKSDKLTEVVLEDRDAMDLEQLKRKHRSDELREIMEADMKYLKALFNKLAREKQNASNGSGSLSSSEAVSLELSGADVPVTATEMPVAVEGINMDITI